MSADIKRMGSPMKKEIIVAIAQTVPAVLGDAWMWVTKHELAWFGTALTIVYILSQLFWGWAKFLRRGQQE